jgi:hypothetical protein
MFLFPSTFVLFFLSFDTAPLLSSGSPGRAQTPPHKIFASAHLASLTPRLSHTSFSRTPPFETPCLSMRLIYRSSHTLR